MNNSIEILVNGERQFFSFNVESWSLTKSLNCGVDGMKLELTAKYITESDPS